VADPLALPIALSSKMRVSTCTPVVCGCSTCSVLSDTPSSDAMKEVETVGALSEVPRPRIRKAVNVLVCRSRRRPVVLAFTRRSSTLHAKAVETSHFGQPMQLYVGSVQAHLVDQSAVCRSHQLGHAGAGGGGGGANSPQMAALMMAKRSSGLALDWPTARERDICDVCCSVTWMAPFGAACRAASVAALMKSVVFTSGLKLVGLT